VRVWIDSSSALYSLGFGSSAFIEGPDFDLDSAPYLSVVAGAGFVLDWPFAAMESVDARDDPGVSAAGLLDAEDFRPFCLAGSGAASWAGTSDFDGGGGFGGAFRGAGAIGGAVPTQFEKRSSGSIRCSTTGACIVRAESKTASVKAIDGPWAAISRFVETGLGSWMLRASATLAIAVRTDCSKAVEGADGTSGLSGVSSMNPGLSGSLAVRGEAATGRLTGSAPSGEGREEVLRSASNSLQAQTMR
jgi:hypothetical protein